MDLKSFLKSFWQIISIAKIFILQCISLYLLSYAGGLWAEVTGVRGCPPRNDQANVLFYLILAASLIIGFLSFHPIFFPRVWLEQIGKEIMGSKVDFRFPFFSTHPSYVFLDILLLMPAILLFWNGLTENICEFNHEWGMGLTAFIVAITFPALRLIFWYVLGKQIYAMQVKNIKHGILWWYILVFPLIAYFSYTYTVNDILPRYELPVVNSETFKGGLDANPEFFDKIVRVRGNMIQGIAKCGLWGKKDRTDFPYGTVVLDMGEGNGEILIQAKKPSLVLDLEANAQRGGVIEAIGRLSKLPNPEKKMLCGIGKLSEDLKEGGRALLEIELPK
jgi:hypothetical protein